MKEQNKLYEVYSKDPTRYFDFVVVKEMNVNEKKERVRRSRGGPFNKASMRGANDNGRLADES